MSDIKVFEDEMDPADDDTFWARLARILGGNDTVVAVNGITLDAPSIVNGVTVSAGEIDADPTTMKPATAIKFTLGVTADKHNDPAFAAPAGHNCDVTFNFTTAKGRTLKKTVRVPIIQG